jgi:uncharacterized membrane protein
MPNHFRSRRTLYLSAAVLAALLILAWLRPAFLLDAGDYIGYAVCHQLPERSFSLAGRRLPLCARCSGTFLGVFTAYSAVVLRRRTRCTALPPVPITALFLLGVGLWALDGANSYLELLGLPHLYTPQNALRLAAGMLNGLALGTLVWPVVAMTVWREPEPAPVLRGWREYGALLAAGGLEAVLILLGWPPALYLLALISLVGVLAILLTVNTLIVVVLLRRENRASAPRDLFLPAGIAALVSAGMIAGMDALRWWLTLTYHLPF